MPDRICSIHDCNGAVRSRGYCYAHYMKHWRHGDALHEQQHPVAVDLTGQRFGSLVVLEWEPDGRVGKWLCACDCGETTRVRTGDLNAGSVASCGDRATHSRLPIVGYWAVHDRLDTDRGSAKTHECVDCGGPAEEWSYDYGDPEPLWLEPPRGGRHPYSLDPERYDPRCVPCHRRFDSGRVAA